MAFEFVARNGILSLSDITGSAGLQLTGLSADASATTGLFKDGNDAIVTRTFGDLAFTNAASATVATASYVAAGNIAGTIDISDQTNLSGGTNLTLNGDAMDLDANISLTSVTASFKGNLDGNASTATSATNSTNASKVATINTTTNGTYYLTFVDSNNTSATNETVNTTAGIQVNPNTDKITATAFIGALEGTATSASHVPTAFDTVSVTNDTITLTDMAGSTTDVTVNNVADAVSASYAVTASYAENAGLSVATYNTSTNFPVVFHDSSGESLGTDTVSTDFSYNPSTNTLTVANLTGTAATASYVAVANVDGLGNSATQDTGSMTVFESDKIYVGNTDLNTTLYLLGTGGSTADYKSIYKDDSDAVYFNPFTGIVTATGFSGNLTGNVTGNLTGTAATASAVDVTSAIAAADYRITMVDAAGTTGETLYVDGGLLFNPNTNKLTVSGDTAIGGNGSVTGNLTVGGTLTAQEFRTEYLTQVVIAQSGSTKLGNTPDDIHEVTGSLSVSENISLGSQLFVSASSIKNVGSGSTADIAAVPYGPDYTVTAVHFDYKLYKANDAWYRTGTVMSVGKQGGTIIYTDTSTNEPSSNDAVLQCVDGGSSGIKLQLDNQTPSSIDVDVHIRRF